MSQFRKRSENNRKRKLCMDICWFLPYFWRNLFTMLFSTDNSEIILDRESFSFGFASLLYFLGNFDRIFPALISSLVNRYTSKLITIRNYKTYSSNKYWNKFRFNIYRKSISEFRKAENKHIVMKANRHRRNPHRDCVRESEWVRGIGNNKTRNDRIEIFICIQYQYTDGCWWKALIRTKHTHTQHIYIDVISIIKYNPFWDDGVLLWFDGFQYVRIFLPWPQAKNNYSM